MVAIIPGVSSSVSEIESEMEFFGSSGIGAARLIQLEGVHALLDCVGPRKLPVGLGRFLGWLLGGEDAAGLLNGNGLGNEAVRALKFEFVR